MTGLLLRLLGKKAVHHAVAKHTDNGGFLDAKLGFALLRDRRVPVVTKLLALAIGLAATAMFVSWELPLEAVIGLVLPMLGFGLDAIADGLEGIIGPIVIGSLLLPHLAPQEIVAQIRAERSGIPLETAQRFAA